MASIITATVANGLTQSADNSGVLQLASGVGNLVTIPSTTGTMALTTTGLSQSDQWHLTTSAGNITGQVLSANWARMNPAGFAKIGAGMTESSGVFTFPTTGLYLISAQARFLYDSPRRYVQLFIQTTTNNSTYADIALASGNLYLSGSDSYSTPTTQTFLNVTSTSLCKVRFYVEAASATNVNGSSNRYDTGATFIRIGESQ
jgi:hypothetical protein